MRIERMRLGLQRSICWGQIQGRRKVWKSGARGASGNVVSITCHPIPCTGWYKENWYVKNWGEHPGPGSDSPEVLGQPYHTELSLAGVLGVLYHPQNLEVLLILFQPQGADYVHPRIWKPNDSSAIELVNGQMRAILSRTSVPFQS